MVMTSNSHRRSPGSIPQRSQIYSPLLAWNWHVEMLGEGDDESVASCRMGEVEGAGTVEMVCVGTLLRMGCDSFLMPVCGSIGGGEPLWKQSGLPCEHSVENKWWVERQRQNV